MVFSPSEGGAAGGAGWTAAITRGSHICRVCTAAAATPRPTARSTIQDQLSAAGAASTRNCGSGNSSAVDAGLTCASLAGGGAGGSAGASAGDWVAKGAAKGAATGVGVAATGWGGGRGRESGGEGKEERLGGKR